MVGGGGKVGSWEVYTIDWCDLSLGAAVPFVLLALVGRVYNRSGITLSGGSPGYEF